VRKLRGSLFGAVLVAGAMWLGACGGGDGDDGDGGGGGETVSADAYAAAFCNAFGAWIDEVGNLSSGLQSGLQPGLSEEEGQEVLRDFLGAILTATDQLADDLDSAGAPDVENGEEFADALAGAIDDARAALATAQEGVEELPLDSPEGFQEASDELGNEINDAFDQAGDPLEDFDIPELEGAFEDEPACAEIPSF
jgi:hypothetical protein